MLGINPRNALSAPTGEPRMREGVAELVPVQPVHPCIGAQAP